MKVSFIVPARNKENYIGACAKSVLAQTYPCDIFFSDQGSEDGTRAVLTDLVFGYKGHHNIHILDCPNTGMRGMPGLNDHLNWIHSKIDGDIVVMCSADDLNHPDRVKYTVKAFEEYNPSYVNTSVQYLTPDDHSTPKFTSFPDKSTRWLKPEETIRHQIGSAGSSAWARDLYEKHGPLTGCEQQDMILPIMALFERGIYYVDLPLHTYIEHSNLDNTGFQGQLKAAVDEVHKAQLVEVNNFMHVRNWTSVLLRMKKQGWALADPAYNALMEKLAETSWAWAAARESLIVNRIEPIMMRV